ncbi:MAG: inositol monophosphatase [Bacteroidetes bacterium]|nr:inositol monophosphatase [Bacteroidota bacterium]
MKAFDKLEEAVKFCGKYAVKQQSLVTRDYKSDGSVLTEADIYIDSYLKNVITKNFPNSVLITEESGEVESKQEQKPDYYFILDPIDGTDLYSQGAPGWCIALGILDKNLIPCGCMIYAPRWGVGMKEGLFFRLDPEGELLLNQKPFILKKQNNTVKQLVMSSNTHRYLDLRKFTGKCRVFGSCIIHLLAPVIHIKIDAALCTSGYIWDIAAAHSVLLYLGLALVKSDGTDFTYSENMLNGKPNNDILFAGSKNQCNILRKILCE